MNRGWGKRPDETKLAAFAMIFGVWLLVPVNSVQSPGMVFIAELADEWLCGAMFLSSGALHMFAVWVNGLHWWTPFYRAFTSFILVGMWALFAFGFAEFNLWSTGVLVYLALAGLAAKAFMDAISDCRRRVNQWKDENAGV